MFQESQVLIQVGHVKGRLIEALISTGPTAMQKLNKLEVTEPQAYGRLRHYGQTRFKSRVIPTLQKYYFTLDTLDFATIGIMIKKELESYK